MGNVITAHLLSLQLGNPGKNQTHVFCGAVDLAAKSRNVPHDVDLVPGELLVGRAPARGGRIAMLQKGMQETSRAEQGPNFRKHSKKDVNLVPLGMRQLPQKTRRLFGQESLELDQGRSVASARTRPSEALRLFWGCLRTRG